MLLGVQLWGVYLERLKREAAEGFDREETQRDGDLGS